MTTMMVLIIKITDIVIIMILLQMCWSYTVRYDTIDDLHWKTDRQAASFI